ncbi:MAG: CsbD family protein [Ilumatobacteraceae bacterium]
MGLFDKAKEMMGKVDTDDAKDTAGKAKDSADGLVDEHGDKIPDSVEKTYDKASDAAEKVIPGEDDKD